MGDMLPLLVGAGEAGAIYAEVNGRLAKAGVSITREDARALAELRGEILAGLGRVEFGGPAVVVLAEALACSPTLGQDGVFDTLAWPDVPSSRRRQAAGIKGSPAMIFHALRPRD
jgi:hypothetical protein